MKSGTPTEFMPAPVGTRVRVVTWLVIGVVAIVVLIEFAVSSRVGLKLWEPMVTTVVLAPLLLAFWWASRIRAYRIEGGELQVVRVFYTARFPLAGLQEIQRDPQAMRGAWKIYGNDGLGAVAGRYRSKRLGKFRAYLTDADRALVLRWPGNTLVISPAQIDPFTAAVQAHLRSHQSRSVMERSA